MAGSVKPVGIELPHRPPLAALPAIADRARALRVRLSANMIDPDVTIGAGDDHDALRMPDAVWGRMVRSGVSVLLTDEPEALVAMGEAETQDEAADPRAASPQDPVAMLR